MAAQGVQGPQKSTNPHLRESNADLSREAREGHGAKVPSHRRRIGAFRCTRRGVGGAGAAV